MIKFAILGLALVAAPVLAQDAGSNFNGPYIGAQAGWQQDRQTLTVTTPSSSATNSGSGLSYGGQVGYDIRLGGSAVLGGEVSLTGRSGRTDFDTFDLKQGRTFNATARLGFMPDDQSLIYARGGYANARYTIENATTRVSENRNGFTVGAGYERYLAQNVSARLEYNYSDFGADDLSAAIGAGSRLDYSRHAVTAGVNLRF
ncbi:outer membrane beta-barrel protein [Sandarakinorhabdus sp.]|uniref:outer membrane protein n=1 Tax=Sandarakinorhabdus sp. TaxID=1916663 RepID=UPI00286D8207|nr:outer membrane beta-barrel protein [Sandarakinorhabdus sp.]